MKQNNKCLKIKYYTSDRCKSIKAPNNSTMIGYPFILLSTAGKKCERKTNTGTSDLQLWDLTH